MKIAIQGHPTRGKEIIQILRSLGATSYGTYDTCSHPEWYWYINKNKEITCDPKRSMCNYKLYTLEEFEKEFPFKIGDKVTIITKNPYKIIALEYYNGRLSYKLDNGLNYSSNVLTPYKEMKEERNITLTLDKAKEWYKKGGDLKQVALQAFTEKELTEVELPESWEEFCNDFPLKNEECYVGACSDITMISECVEGRDVEMDKNVCPSQKSAEAHLAMMQLEQLRDCYRGLFITVIGMPVWNISMYNGKPHIIQAMWGKNHSFLSFQSEEVAEKYLKNFKPLIEKAGDLIS